MEPEPIVLLDPMLVTTIISVVIPLLVGILTKLRAHPGVKAVMLIILNGVGAAIGTAVGVDGVAVISRTTVYQFIVGCVVSIATYYGVWKPTGVSGGINRATATVGLGSSRPRP